MEPYSGYKGKISELEEIASEFKFERLTDDLKNNWEAAVKAYPGPDKPLFFLEDEFIEKLMETFSFLKEIEDKFREAAKTARENERIRIIAWLWYHTAYVTKDLSSIYAWPNLSKVMGELEGMIPLLVLFTGYENMFKVFDERNLPENIRAANYGGVEMVFREFKDKYKEAGRGNRNLAWAVRYFQGVLYYIGRLQYEFLNHQRRILVYRSRKTDKTMCLLEGGQAFTADGQYPDPDRGDKEGAWTSEYYEDDRYIYGNPVSPEAYALNKKVRLDKSEWELVLKRGDPGLIIHIPGGRKLDKDEVKQSFLDAVEFFDTYFPDYKWKAIICTTWFLDRRVRQFLKSGSNILNFQDSFYLVPVPPSSVSGVYRFLFQTDICDPRELKAVTQFQQDIKDYLIKGGKIEVGTGFLLRGDIIKGPGYYKESYMDTLKSVEIPDN